MALTPGQSSEPPGRMAPGSGWSYSGDSDPQRILEMVLNEISLPNGASMNPAIAEQIANQIGFVSKEQAQTIIQDINMQLSRLAMHSDTPSTGPYAHIIDAAREHMQQADGGAHRQMMGAAMGGVALTGASTMAASLSGLFGGAPPEEAKACGACLLGAGVEPDAQNLSLSVLSELGPGLTPGMGPAGRSMGMGA